MICNYCKKEIKKRKGEDFKGFNIEISVWMNRMDGDNQSDDILMTELHYDCAIKVIKEIKENVPKINTKVRKR